MNWATGGYAESVGVRDSGVHVFFELDRTSTPITGNGSVIVNAWPNPLPGQGSIAFRLGFSDDVRLDLYDVSGRRVRGWERPVTADTQNLIHWEHRKG